MNTKIIMTLAAVILGTTGIALTFMPDVLLDYAGMEESETALLLMQILDEQRQPDRRDIQSAGGSGEYDSLSHCRTGPGESTDVKPKRFLPYLDSWGHLHSICGMFWHYFVSPPG